MDLTDLSDLALRDPQNMLAHIDSLPIQLQAAWKLGQSLPLPECKEIRQVIIGGMGGSAIGAELLAAYAASTCRVPIIIHRDYGLPAYAQIPETLVIVSSHSGNTEETLDSFETARVHGCTLMAVTTGGQLGKKAVEAKTPLWQFEHKGQPRAAVGYSFGLLLAALTRLGLITDPENEINEAVEAMRTQQESLRADIPVAKNPAKRLAGQLMERCVIVVASGYLAPVARRWKTQINEIAKAAAQFEILPEADHNTLAGLLNPQPFQTHTMTIFLRAPSDHPRNRLRLDLTRQGFMMEGMNTDFYNARGNSPLAHIWTALHFGDYNAYYLALAYGMDPTPVFELENLKATLKSID
jgi:glucose/mannose-6-phosphate isomerase